MYYIFENLNYIILTKWEETFILKKKSLAKDQYIFNFKSFTSIFAGLVCFAYFQSSFFNTCMHIPINRNKINFW